MNVTNLVDRSNELVKSEMPNAVEIKTFQLRIYDMYVTAGNSLNYQIALLGGNGFIARNLLNVLPTSSEVILVTRNSKPSPLHNQMFPFIEVTTFGELNLSKRHKPFDLIINLLRLKRGSNSSIEGNELNHKILQFIESNSSHETQIINLGTYTQHYFVKPSSYNFEYSRNKFELNKNLLNLQTKQGFSYLELSLYTVFGPGDSDRSLVSSLLDCAKYGHKLTINSGEQIVSYTHVQDVVEMITRFFPITNQRVNGHFSFWPEPPIRIIDLVCTLENGLNKSLNLCWSHQGDSGHELYDYNPAVFPPQVAPDFEFKQLDEFFLDEVLNFLKASSD